MHRNPPRSDWSGVRVQFAVDQASSLLWKYPWRSRFGEISGHVDVKCRWPGAEQFENLSMPDPIELSHTVQTGRLPSCMRRLRIFLRQPMSRGFLLRNRGGVSLVSGSLCGGLCSQSIVTGSRCASLQSKKRNTHWKFSHFARSITLAGRQISNPSTPIGQRGFAKFPSKRK